VDMTTTTPPTATPATPAWQALADHLEELRPRTLSELFEADPDRGRDLTVTAGDLYIDYSKHRVTRETLELLLDLARERRVEQRRDAMFAGAHINTTEDRPVLHTALRLPAGAELRVDGQDVPADVHGVLDRMAEFADRVRDGRWTGATGHQIRTVVNIGIGGSDLGPAMAARALRHYCDGPQTVFVSNVDPADLTSALAELDPATTLVVVVSKTFTTLETMTNAAAARAWIVDALGEAAVPHHFVAVSADTARAAEFGIESQNVFGFWDWVGGRYSVGSAVGLSLMLAIGAERFREFLAGMYAVDEHFRTAPAHANAPVLLGMLGVWYASFFRADSRAVLPYSHDLARLPAYLQQLSMESNGKSVHLDGSPVAAPTGEIIWGEPGTNGQHAFHQLLHQGTRLVPVDFIGFVDPTDDLPSLDGRGTMHDVLLANLLAQAKVMAFGRSAEDVARDGTPEALVGHTTMPGNQPSTTILGPRLTPATLGQLIALYEHQVFVQGVVWNINSFDQWGVELGKASALELTGALVDPDTPSSTGDSSTDGLVARIRHGRPRR